MFIPLGVKYSDTVTFIPEPSGRSLILCTSPFPNVVVPTRLPLSLSLMAPARISDALALPSFTRTTSGRRSEERRVGKECRSWWRSSHSIRKRLLVIAYDSYLFVY